MILIPSVCASLVVAFLSVSAVSHKENCRVVEFVNKVTGKALDDHVIAETRASELDLCELQCYLNSDCVSFNFALNDTGEENICQLNNSTDQNKLKPINGYIYVEAENACQSAPCLNNGKCQHGFTNKTFRCLCLTGFEGDFCEEGILGALRINKDDDDDDDD